MKKNRNCKIVQDLLPNFIENLTNEETNEFIEEHLKECDACKVFLENVKKDLKMNDVKQDTKEVNYIKKYNIRLKKMRYILIGIIYALIIIILIFFGRRLIIFNSLANKLSKYPNSTNYYIREWSYNGPLGGADCTETWVKDGNMLKKFDNKVTTILKDGVYYEYYGDENGVEEITEEMKENLLWPNGFFAFIQDELRNPLNVLKFSLKEVIVNGKKCYQISKNDESGTSYFLNKETGLIVRLELLAGGMSRLPGDRSEIQSTLRDYKFEFDCVKDKDLEINKTSYDLYD